MIASTGMTQAAGVKKKKRSAWLWIGCGCLLFLLIVVLVVALAIGWAFRRMAHFAEDMANPEKARERVYEVLDSPELPPGYYPLAGIKFFKFFELAVISDTPQNSDQDRKSVFVYVNGGSWMKNSLDENWYEDLQQSTSGNMDVDLGDEIGSGQLTVGDLGVDYTAHRGSVRFQSSRMNGVVTAMLFHCPQDNRARLGLWLTPEPENAEAAPAGAADPAAIERFLGSMSLCPGP